MIRSMRFWRLLALAVPLIGGAGDTMSSPAGKPAAAGALSFEHTVQPLFREYCCTCHNARMNTGGLNLESYNTAHSVEANRERWETVLARLIGGQMPPAGLPRQKRHYGTRCSTSSSRDTRFL